MSLRPINTTLLVFLCCVLVISSSLAQQAASESQEQLSKSCIDRIIAVDDSLAAIRNVACISISLGETIRHYADALLALDYTGCPDNFRYAFEGHAYAWQQLIPFTEQYPDMHGEMHELFMKFEAGKDSTTFKTLVDAIWNTWHDVEAAMGD